MHTLQPKHSILKQEEVKSLLEKYNLSVSQLPKIKSTDPALPANTTPGQVIKIERESETKKEVYYRVVV